MQIALQLLLLLGVLSAVLVQRNLLRGAATHAAFGGVTSRASRLFRASARRRTLGVRAVTQEMDVAEGAAAVLPSICTLTSQLELQCCTGAHLVEGFLDVELHARAKPALFTGFNQDVRHLIEDAVGAFAADSEYIRKHVVEQVHRTHEVVAFQIRLGLFEGIDGELHSTLGLFFQGKFHHLKNSVVPDHAQDSAI